jgi:ubiquinone/menaquinone biosynthesis C-methylase UbiE
MFGGQNFIRILEYNTILKWAEFKEHDVVLDAACGNGELSYLISKQCMICIGLDNSKKSVVFFKKMNKKSKIIIADSENIPFKDCTFDKVVCNTSLQLFPNDIKSIEEMSRVMKKNGLLLLTVDSFTHPKIQKNIKRIHRKRNNVFNYYTKESLEKKLNPFGIRIVKHKYYINNTITSFIFNLGIKTNWSSLWSILSLLLFPFYILERNTKINHGYGLAVLGKKV